MNASDSYAQDMKKSFIFEKLKKLSTNLLRRGPTILTFSGRVSRPLEPKGPEGGTRVEG